MSKKKRRHFSPEEKFNIVKQVLSKAKTVSEVSDEYSINPNLYYKWQAEFFEAALSGFKEKSQGRTTKFMHFTLWRSFGLRRGCC